MTNSQEIDDRDYSLDLFRNRSHSKGIPVSVLYKNMQYFGKMSFNARKNSEVYISIENRKATDIFTNETELRFGFFIGIFYTFPRRTLYSMNRPFYLKRLPGIDEVEN